MHTEPTRLWPMQRDSDLVDEASSQFVLTTIKRARFIASSAISGVVLQLKECECNEL